MKIQILTTTNDKTYRYFDDNNGMRWFFTSDIKRNLCKQFDYFILKHDLFDYVEHITPDMFELDDVKYFKHQRKLKAINRKGLYLATKHDKKIKEFVEEHFADIIYYGKLHDEENALRVEVVQGDSQELAIPEQNQNTPEIQIFANAEFGEVRTLMIDGEPWFVGKDVAEALGYVKSRNAVAKYVEKDDALNWGVIDSIGRTQQNTIINESGLYSLILSSKLPEAKKFKRWVTSEVLPSLRKNGGYLVGQEQMSDMELLARSVLLSQKLMKQKDEQISNQQKLIEDMTPKSTYCDDVLQSSKVVSVSVIAKDYGMSAKQLNAWLREHKIQYKLGETWLLYQKYANNGYTKTTTDTYKNARDGKERTVIHTKWTQKGRMFIYEQLSKEGILPIMELSNCEV